MKTLRSTANRLLAVLMGFVLVASGPAVAWNAAGHRLVAIIAWEQMTPEARREAGRLLRLHPDYSRWQKRAGDDNGDRRMFSEASTWPDEIRQDSRFFSGNIDEPTPSLPGYPDMERRRSWHFVNIPLDGSPDAKPLSGQLGRRLPELERSLAAGTEEAARIYALPWLIHLIGDAHQPLHTSARVDATGNWDTLGNALEVRNPFNPRKPQSTLHAYWDDLPGPPWLRGERLDQAAQTLIATHPDPSSAGSSELWIEESWRLARDSGYPPGNESTPVITGTFYAASLAIAQERVTLAGYRLADVLNRAFRAPGRAGNQR